MAAPKHKNLATCRKSSKNGRRPVWMKKEHLAELKWGKEAQSRWKQEQATQEEYRDIA